MSQVSPPSISVIICTHNPRQETLARTISHLRAQSMPDSDWELLVVDNASSPSITNTLVSWHPAGQLVAEPKLGLTNARLAGIAAAQGELLLFVDDDNWLYPDYLATAADLLARRTSVGAASGQCFGVFEREPKEWQKSYLWLVVVRTFTEPRITRDMSAREALPAGAGMCVRRGIAMSYARFCRDNPAARILDRRGTQVLIQGGDTHMVQCAVDAGYEVGVFPELRLQHYIPDARLELKYLSRLYAGIVTFGFLMCHIKGQRVPWTRRDFRWWWRQARVRLRNFHHQASFLQAEIDGEREARRLLIRLQEGEQHDHIFRKDD